MTAPAPDPREPEVCPRCGTLCAHDGWGHVHPNGVGIGSCAAPDPDLRDQLVEAMRARMSVHPPWTAERVADALMPTITAKLEAQARTVANQRAAEERIVAEATDLCWKATPFTEDEEGMVAAYLLPAGVVHRLLGALQGAGYPAAFRALASPAPAPQPSGWEDRRRRGFDCPTCEGTGRTVHHDMPDGSARAQRCLACDGTGKAPAPAPRAEEQQPGVMPEGWIDTDWTHYA